MKASPLKDSFNAGEISPLMAARVRIDKYASALETCENMIPLVQGGVTRRPGTMHVHEVKDSSVFTRLVPFEFSVTQAYQIEFGNLYCRFYKDHGIIESSPGVIYEVVTTYTTAELADLKFTQSADILYITHPSHKPALLVRYGHASWSLISITLYDGPYLPINVTTTTITPSATTGAITLTASGATFVSTDVGRIVRIKHSTTWGYAEITAFTSNVLVNATVVYTFGAATASATWRLGLYSETTGYPSCSMFFEDRLFFGGCTQYPQRIDGSSSSQYGIFSPSNTDSTVVDSNAVAFSLNSNDVNVVRWMMDDEKGLMVGTVGGEWCVRPSSLSSALSPTNITAKRSTAFGSANVQAVRAGRASLYIQRAGTKVRELAYVYEIDGFRSPDMTVLSEHITKGGLTAISFQQEPWQILWFVRNDGQLIGMTYERDQEVIGWHRQIIGGSYSTGDAVVESVSCIPSPDGTSDELWLIVKRTIFGSTKRYVEYITPAFDEDDTINAFFVDSGLTYDGVPATTITGLDHLEGQEVSVLTDGAAHPARTVVAGSITLALPASVVHVGLGYNADVGTLNIEAGAADGTAQGKTKRIHKVTARLHKTLGLKYGPNSSNLDTMTFRSSSDFMGSPPELFTGDKEVEWNGHYEKEGKMYFRQDQPLPFTLLGLFPQLHTQDR
jgi:hypothetical protein